MTSPHWISICLAVSLRLCILPNYRSRSKIIHQTIASSVQQRSVANDRCLSHSSSCWFHPIVDDTNSSTVSCLDPARGLQRPSPQLVNVGSHPCRGHHIIAGPRAPRPHEPPLLPGLIRPTPISSAVFRHPTHCCLGRSFSMQSADVASQFLLLVQLYNGRTVGQ